jgi:hypothetical protein
MSPHCFSPRGVLRAVSDDSAYCGEASVTLLDAVLFECENLENEKTQGKRNGKRTWLETSQWTRSVHQPYSDLYLP